MEAPIDPERAARAAQMGFDTSRVWYHGTPAGEIAEFDPSRTPDERLAYGKGVYVSADPVAASGYSRPGASWGNDTDDAQPTVYPVFIRSQHPFDLDKLYPNAEVKRILFHCFGEGINHLPLWRELMQDMGHRLDDDDDDDNYEPDEEQELEWKLEELSTADSISDVDPDDYEEGEDDPEYLEDVRHSIDLEIKQITRQLGFVRQRREEEEAIHKKGLESGRIGGAYGRDIYKAMWTNTSEYHDWKAESSLIGGETEVFQFKTFANEWLEELGYDSIVHVDGYNPGAAKVSHNVTILFRPNQVRSVFAKFDDSKANSNQVSD